MINTDGFSAMVTLLESLGGDVGGGLVVSRSRARSGWLKARGEEEGRV